MPARFCRFLTKLMLHRLRFLPPDFGRLASIADEADARLLRAVIANDSQVMRRLFPPVVQYSLLAGLHAFRLPDRHDRSFIRSSL